MLYCFSVIGQPVGKAPSPKPLAGQSTAPGEALQGELSVSQWAEC